MSLRYERILTPKPAPGEALVRVHAAAITRDELNWPEGRLPATPSYEFSGIVAAVGPGVERAEPGEAVFALISFDRDGGLHRWFRTTSSPPSRTSLGTSRARRSRSPV